MLRNLSKQICLGLCLSLDIQQIVLDFLLNIHVSGKPRHDLIENGNEMLWKSFYGFSEIRKRRLTRQSKHMFLNRSKRMKLWFIRNKKKVGLNSVFKQTKIST